MGEPGKGRPLLPRVQDNGRVLREAYRLIATAIREERAIVPAAEWLVDNFHVVDEQLREIRDDLPAGFYRELPKLADGPLAGYPRVYGIAWAFVAHTDSRFDPDTLRRFVRAYQRVEPLTIGELWAVAITLRVVLVENLRRLAEAIVRGRAARQEADALADDLLGISGRPGERRPRSIGSRVPGWSPPSPCSSSSGLRDQDPAVTPVLLWLEQRLAAQGTTPDEIVRVEHQRQAAMNVTVRNVIMSMSLMSSLDWTEFFESVSLVDEVLRGAGPDYAAMDFATRDGYRHAIEELARGSGRSELDIARETVLHAKRGGRPRSEERDDRREDPGFYLIGDGRLAFERALGFRAPATRRLLRAYVAAATPGYLGTIVVLTGLILALPLLADRCSRARERWVSVVLGLLALVPASDLAIALLNRIVTTLVTPIALPRLELRDGVPSHLRTMVVVPTLLTDRAEVAEQIERLEVHYLANPDGDLRFALLSDWTDAPTETVAGDEDTLAAAREGIERLNRRHGPATEGGERFFLFHRRRLWNESERAWMGWERKRGKLHELNRLLRGADGHHLPADGGPRRPGDPLRHHARRRHTAAARRRQAAGRRDGASPQSAAARSRARIASSKGYAVLQPRVTPPLPGGEGSFFQRLSSGPAGIDPYAAAVSDVYQDLFGEGSYTGKGIYDVDAFEAALAGRVPENALLSHDLFEGVFARAGLVTDVELFESAPSHYGVAAARQHRWARGDWQLLPWILRAPMPVIGRWKMLDNLRRTLSAPAALLTLIAAWALPAHIAGGVDRIRPRGDRAARARAGPRRADPSAARHLEAQPHPRRRPRPRPGRRADGAHDHDAGAPGVADERRDRAHARARVRDASPSAGVGDRRAGEGRSPPRSPRLLPAHGSGVALAAVAAVIVAWRRPEAWPLALPFLLLWAASPAVASLDQPPEARGGDRAAVARGCARPPADRPSDLALLRDVRRSRGPRAAAGQFPGGSEPGRGAPHVAHEHRALSAVHRGRARFRLARDRRRRRAARGHDRDDERPRALPRALLQLVRHEGRPSARSEVRVVGRQRQSRRPSDRARARLSGDDRSARCSVRRRSRGSRTPRCSSGNRRAPWPMTDARARSPGSAWTRRSTASRRRSAESPHSPGQWAGRLAELEASARIVTGLARTLVEEDGARAQPDVVVWADALQASVESHARDLDTMMPWARLPRRRRHVAHHGRCRRHRVPRRPPPSPRRHAGSL